jgi:glucokinase
VILAGDIGGTKTVLALFEAAADGLRRVRDGTVASKAHTTLEEILERFLQASGAPRPRAACFGVAGPVIGGRVKTTNLPWLMDEHELSRVTGGGPVKILNDLQAMAYGMLWLPPDELASLNEGARPRRDGNVAVIAAGTGLGEGMLCWDGQRHHPVASEGGHCSFAPGSDAEIDLLRYLRDKFGGHVSTERALSGPGLHNIYLFLRDTGRETESPAMAAKLAEGDPNAAIGQAGLAGNDALCGRALDMFCQIYGAEAGNVALKCLSVGGVFVGGGIAPKILPALRRGGFLRAFLDKGRLADVLRDMDVNVCLNPRAPLIGAAYYALHWLTASKPRASD